jgi:hypothetical protein
MISISEKAKDELRAILRSEIGEERVKLLNDEDIQQLGSFLLVLRAEAIKRRSREHLDMVR